MTHYSLHLQLVRGLSLFALMVSLSSCTSAPELEKVGAPAERIPAWMAGGFGTGQGQFKQLGAAAIDAAGRIVVVDNELQRLTWFDPEGSAVETVYLSPESGSPALNRREESYPFPEAIQVTGYRSGVLYLLSDRGLWKVEERTLTSFQSLSIPFRVGSAVFGPGQEIYTVDGASVRVFNEAGEALRSWPVASEQEPGANSLEVGPSGEVYVGCNALGTIRVFSPEGMLIREFGSTGSGPGQFEGQIRALAVDTDGNVYAYDSRERAAEVFDSQGNPLFQLSTKGSLPGQNLWVRQFLSDRERRRLVMTDALNYRMDVFDLTGEDVSARNLVVHSVDFPPAAKPDHVVLTLGSNPETDRYLTWRTQLGISSTIAELVQLASDQTTASLDWSKSKKKVVQGSHVEHHANTGPYLAHEVYLSDLSPGQEYAYRVGDGQGNWSDTFSFELANPRVRDLRVVVLGDSRNRMDVWKGIVSAGATSSPDFFISTGDLVATGEHLPDWEGWFHEAHGILAQFPFMPALGNHEMQSPNFFRAFALPRNGPEGLEEEAYSFDYGPSHWIILNTQNDLEKQREWLEIDLEKNTKPWTFLVYHRPAWAGHPTRGDGNLDVRESWAPLFDRYGVDIAWQGHDHYYFRTKAIRAGEVVSPGEGPVYITTGGSGAPLYPIAVNQFAEVAESVDHYCVMEIGAGHCRVTVFRADGTLLDEFDLEPRSAPTAGKEIE